MERLSGWFRQLERADDGQLLAGVCAGLARRLAVEVTLVRLTFILLALASGLGLILYLLLWLLVPRSDTRLAPSARQREIVSDNLRGVEGDLRRAGTLIRDAWATDGRQSRWPRPLTRRWIALLLIFGGAAVVLQSLGLFAWLGPTRAIGLAVIAVGIAVLLAHEWRR